MPPYEAGRLHRIRTRAELLAFRAERKAAQKLSDIELWQLRSLQRAYRGDRGPEVLVFGDSMMYWTSGDEEDKRPLHTMIREQVDAEVLSLVGAGYHGRIVMAFLAALERCRSRPKVVVVPTSVMMTTSPWVGHPEFGYELESRGLLAAAAGRPPRKLERPGADYSDAYDRRPGPSLSGAQHSLGHLRMMLHAKADTDAQRAERLRHRLEYYHGERLEPDSPGLGYVREMGATLTRMGLPSVAYIMPVNREDLLACFGQSACDHAARNAGLVEAAYRDAAPDGHVVNAIFDCPAEDFIDPLHLGSRSRRHLAARIMAELRPRLGPPRST